jgi:hypothetical protein
MGEQLLVEGVEGRLLWFEFGGVVSAESIGQSVDELAIQLPTAIRSQPQGQDSLLLFYPPQSLST